MKQRSVRVISLLITTALTVSPVALAQKTTKANGNATAGNNNGNGGSNVGTGNSGNGVGNTGPGNQGNTKPTGNAGGTTGSSGSSAGGATGSSAGGATGSSAGGTGNGNATAGNNNGNGGSNVGTGNSGNGVGNTGPGNQGNDKPVGNAGGQSGSSQGGSQGNSQGGSQGNSQGGSQGNTHGGSQGNTQGGSQGNTHGGSQGNTHGGSQGNTHGGSQGNSHGGSTGSTTGGNTNGGTTGSVTGSSTGGTTGASTGSTVGGQETGSTVGGQETGGYETGSTSGGQETGGYETGSTNGGQDTGSTVGGETGETTGGNTTGDTTGGETGGDETGGDEGGDNGGDEGSDNGGDQGGNEEQPSQQEKPKTKVKVRVLPLVFGNYDILNKIVNLTQSESTKNANDPVILDDYRDGFQVTQIRMYDVGLGVAPQVYLENAGPLASLATGLVGLAPIKGRMVQYERFTSDEKSLSEMKALPIPYKYDQFKKYGAGESVYYENMGGLLFMGGAGIAGVFMGGSIVAEGTWKTLITKVDDQKAYVQVVKADVRKASLFTGVAVLKVDTESQKQLAQGFSYNFDFSAGAEVVKAYENLLSGNALPAQELAKMGLFSGVQKVDSMKNYQQGRSRRMTLGIPMVAIYNWSTGKQYGQTETITHNDDSKTKLDYGIYFKETNGRFFHKHKQLVRTFYSGKAVTFAQNGKVLSADQKATYLWRYENDWSNSSKFVKAIKTFNKDLGLGVAFNPSIDGREKLGFVRLQAEVAMTDAYTKKLMVLAAKPNFADVMVSNGMSLVSKYFAKGDADELCLNDDDEMIDEYAQCKNRLERETRNALFRIQGILKNMYAAKDNGSQFTAFQAQMGKELTRNQFVLGSVFSLDTECSIAYDVKLEGARVSRLLKKVPANPSCL